MAAKFEKASVTQPNIYSRGQCKSVHKELLTKFWDVMIGHYIGHYISSFLVDR